mmetsp:Transcript_9468/g.14199  ORF Transcript_9468/g.14199 Transcript_9468/m.14199 type:complete len:392 (-) Transcript_9468:174-1349(-)
MLPRTSIRRALVLSALLPIVFMVLNKFKVNKMGTYPGRSRLKAIKATSRRSYFLLDHKFYGIRFGKDGFKGVVLEWFKCKTLVHRNPNEYKSFWDPLEAVKYVISSEDVNKTLEVEGVFDSINQFEGVEIKNIYSPGATLPENVELRTVEEVVDILHYKNGTYKPRVFEESHERYDEGIDGTHKKVRMQYDSAESKTTSDRSMKNLKRLKSPMDEKEIDEDAIVVYTDGACEGNGRKDAVAGYGVYFSNHDLPSISEPLAGKLQTNQRAEMMAVIAAFDALLADNRISNLDGHNSGKQEGKGLPPVIIFSDSTYTLKGIEWMKKWKTNGWKTSKDTPVKNKDLWLEFDKKFQELSKIRPVELRYVKGHAGVDGNERADELAVLGASKKRNL